MMNNEIKKITTKPQPLEETRTQAVLRRLAENGGKAYKSPEENGKRKSNSNIMGRTAVIAAMIPATAVALGTAPNTQAEIAPKPAAGANVANIADANPGTEPIEANFDINDRDAATAWSKNAVEDNRIANNQVRMEQAVQNVGQDMPEQPAG